jgi:hypothetical protein
MLPADKLTATEPKIFGALFVLFSRLSLWVVVPFHRVILHELVPLRKRPRGADQADNDQKSPYEIPRYERAPPQRVGELAMDLVRSFDLAVPNHANGDRKIKMLTGIGRLCETELPTNSLALGYDAEAISNYRP